jgi:hypothetical protein
MKLAWLWILLGAVAGFYVVWHVTFYAIVGFALLKFEEAGFVIITLAER